jgi:hypothetical protein
MITGIGIGFGIGLCAGLFIEKLVPGKRIVVEHIQTVEKLEQIENIRIKNKKNEER